MTLAGRAARRGSATTPPRAAAQERWCARGSVGGGPSSPRSAAPPPSARAGAALGSESSCRHLHPLGLLGEPVLRRDLDRLEQGADRRRVDVLHPRQVLERGPALAGEGQEVAALLYPLAAVELAADQPQGARLGEQLHVGPDRTREVTRAGDAKALGEDIGDAHRLSERLADRESADRVVPGHEAPG